MDWLWSNLLGGIKLYLRKVALETASSLLDQGVIEKFEVEGVGEYQQPAARIAGHSKFPFRG